MIIFFTWAFPFSAFKILHLWLWISLSFSNLEFIELLGGVHSCLLPNLESIWSLFLQIFFLSLSLSPLLWGVSLVIFCVLGDITEIFQDVLILNLCFFVLLKLNNCNWPIYRFNNFFPAYSNLLLNSSSEFFIPFIFFNFGTFI